MESKQKENHLRDVTNTIVSSQKVNLPSGTLNLDKHFDLIHDTHNELQQQLHRIETSTSQTNVDLEQLYSRSKSNNDNLNKLLRNVVDYSNEVITEGNATKADMSLIIKALEELKMRDVSLKDDDFARIKEVMQLMYEESGVNHNELKVELQKLNALKDSDKKIFQEQFDHLEELIKTAGNSANSDKVEEVLKQTQEWSKEFRRELKAFSEHEEQAQFANRQVLTKLSALEKQLQDRASSERSNLVISSHESKINELEMKIQNLENKYESLVGKYSQKYNQFKILQQQLDDLSKRAHTEYSSDSLSSNLYNLKRFHKSSLQMIDEHDSFQSDKRVVSTPVAFANNSDDE
ncbi:hypothetical protein CANMA_002270 [Candida margitis]|uniref:uncharacterized protein n=1 Tax=Candida margitis TaxID=1775924 RepID=UPI0022260EE4|nr:uncharacterized protein CANMA_002270 [Candida margitis]KAI5968525.1 hypothetical protein CANMA_002270 [Candida margitis]